MLVRRDTSPSVHAFGLEHDGLEVSWSYNKLHGLHLLSNQATWGLVADTITNVNVTAVKKG